jgi:hypothetical protein
VLTAEEAPPPPSLPLGTLAAVLGVLTAVLGGLTLWLRSRRAF